MPQLKHTHISPSIEEDAAITAQAIENNTHLTDAELAQFRPASEVLAPDLYAGLIAMNKRGRGAQKAATKKSTTIRLPPDVSAAFEATGAGWQTRIGLALQDWLKTHKPEEVAH